MRPFKIADLKSLNEIPKAAAASWLADAEGSVNYLKANATNDEIVIYASGSSVLIHGALALKSQVPD